MKRRHLIRYGGASLLAAIATTSGYKRSIAQGNSSVSLQWLGHTCFLFTGGGLRVLVNPFSTIGCTAG
nr:MBL fold metallo-hydrolase [Prochloraceae cyanobacterium]